MAVVDVAVVFHAAEGAFDYDAWGPSAACQASGAVEKGAGPA